MSKSGVTYLGSHKSKSGVRSFIVHTNLGSGLSLCKQIWGQNLGSKIWGQVFHCANKNLGSGLSFCITLVVYSDKQDICTMKDLTLLISLTLIS